MERRLSLIPAIITSVFLSAFFFFLFGIAVGSFVNVLTLRYHTGRGLLGRSACFSCGHNIPWYDLIPVVSFLLLRGRCRFCKAKLSIQYPLVELASGLLFLALSLKFFSSDLLFQAQVPPFSTLYLLLTTYFLIFPLLLAIFVYDLRHKIIPDALVWLFAGLSFLHASLGAAGFLGDGTSSAILAGPVLAAPFAFLWVFSRGWWIGLGDAKLSLGIGWLLGLEGGASAIILGIWIGAAVSLLLILAGKISDRFPRHAGLFSFASGLTMKSEIPLGPFLILGTLIIFFTKLSVFSFFSW